MAKTGRDYIYGSLATEVKERQKTAPDIRVLPGLQKSSEKKFKIGAIITIAIVFIMMLSIVYRYAIITEKNYSVSKTEKQNLQIQSDINNIKIDMANSIDRKAIEEYAVNTLGMQLPDSSQKIYVSVPAKDKTRIMSGNYVADKGLLQNMADGITGFFGLLF